MYSLMGLKRTRGEVCSRPGPGYPVQDMPVRVKAGSSREDQSESRTGGDVKDTWIDRFFVVVVIVDGVFVEMRADERVVAEHFVVHRVFVVRIDVERVRRFLIADLIDALIHLTLDSAPFGWSEILDNGGYSRIFGKRENEGN